MNKKFLTSVATGLLGLTLVASCSHFGKKDDASCGAKNGCASSKKECNKCSSESKKAECNKSLEKKSEAKKAKPAKTTTATPAANTATTPAVKK